MNFHRHRPSVPQQIRENVTEFINRLHDEYQAWDTAYQGDLREFIQRCGFLTIGLRNDSIFEELARHPYWKKSRQRPKQNGRGKWAVYAMCRPDSKESRKVVGKYGRIIDILLEQGVQPKDFAEVMKERHGINLIIGDRNKRARDGSTGSNATAKAVKKLSKAHKTQIDDPDDHDTKTGFNTCVDENLFVQATEDLMSIVSYPGRILVSATVSWDSSSKKWLIVADAIIRDDV